MKKLPPILLLALLVTSSISAQTSKAEKHHERQEFDDALQTYRSALADDPNDPQALFGLARLYADSLFPQHQLDTAYQYVDRADRAFRKMPYKERNKLQKRGMNSTELRNFEKEVVNQAFREALEQNTLAALEHALEHFPKPAYKLKSEAGRRINLLAFEEAQEQGSMAAYEALLDEYGPGLQERSPGLYRQAEEAFFEAFLREKGWTELRAFTKAYPDNPYVQDTALLAFQQLRTQSDPLRYQEFLTAFPDSRFRPMARDSLWKYTFSDPERKVDLRQLAFFAEEFGQEALTPERDPFLARAIEADPRYELAKPILSHLEPRQFPQTFEVVYRLHAHTGELEILEDFARRYPTAVDSARLQHDLAAARLLPNLKLENGFLESKRDIFENYLQRAAPNHPSFVALQKMLERQLVRKDWIGARETIETYRPLFGDDDQRLSDLLALLGRPELGLEPERLPATINSGQHEYTPVLSADNRQLYFCRFETDENIYRSTWEQGEWQKAEPIAELNEGFGHQAPLTLSADGTRLLAFIRGKIFYSDKTATGWSTPHSISDNVNEADWQGMASMSADGQVLIFAAKRKDVIGFPGETNIDLYLSFRQQDGDWGPAHNLGTTINTPYEDRSPFLHPDMKTLYFSSAGHGGLGGLDVFKTTRLDDSWTRWSAPVNLGKEINTVSSDWGYKISTDGTTAYFAASTGGSAGQQDIYQVALPIEVRPEEVATISGVLRDLEGKPIDAGILIEDLADGRIVSRLRSDPETGRFYVVLPLGKIYSYVVDKKGYFPVANHLDLRGSTEGQQVLEDIQLVEVPDLVDADISLQLKNLFFETDKYQIKPESYPELNRLAQLVQEYRLRLTIAGHTDDQGTAAYNQQLSENRAKATKAYLIDKGCDPDRIETVGYGQTRPVAGNATEEGRAKNRRVEIRFSKE